MTDRSSRYGMVVVVCLASCAIRSSADAYEPALSQVVSRKSQSHRGQPTPLSQTAPDLTGSAKVSKQNTTSAAPAGAQPDDEALPPLFNLPVASRARMRSCGDKWREIKMAGFAGEEIWRDFATRCLSAKD